MLDEYLRDHGFRRIAKRLNKTGVIDLIGTAAPGIDDVVVLGKVKQLARDGSWDLIVVDGPAAGHAITFLTSARGLGEAARAARMNSRSFRARTSPRTIRAVCIQLVMPIRLTTRTKTPPSTPPTGGSW